MALSVIVEKRKFESEFNSLMDRLRLELLTARQNHPMGSLEELHRKFVYELHRFKEKLETEDW
jgi:hypothetical protein